MPTATNRSVVQRMEFTLAQKEDELLRMEDQRRELYDGRALLQNERDSLRDEVQRQALEVERIQAQSSNKATAVLESYEAAKKALQEKEMELLERGSTLQAKDQELGNVKQDVQELTHLLEASDKDFARIRDENQGLKKLSDLTERILRRFDNSPEKVEKFLVDVDQIGLARCWQVDGHLRCLERHLQRSVEGRGGGPKEHWTQHGTLSAVRERYNCMNKEFLQKFFVRVWNGPYDSFHRRTIRVYPREADKGELVVVLNHDKGCAINLAYTLKRKPEVTDVEQVGVLLAMLIRVVHKDFVDFEIRCG